MSLASGFLKADAKSSITSGPYLDLSPSHACTLKNPGQEKNRNPSGFQATSFVVMKTMSSNKMIKTNNKTKILRVQCGFIVYGHRVMGPASSEIQPSITPGATDSCYQRN